VERFTHGSFIDGATGGMPGYVVEMVVTLVMT
jgi:hypothetical protein